MTTAAVSERSLISSPDIVDAARTPVLSTGLQ
jgi:hypothetical protein